jgi:hypothetical protein
MITEKQKMLAGGLSGASDPELVADRAAAWRGRYNASPGASAAVRLGLLRERLERVRK